MKKAIQEDVLKIIKSGEKIVEYPDDEPFPSCIILGFAGNRPIHVVLAVDENTQSCHIVTAYDPNPNLWEKNFKNRWTS